MPLYRPHVFSDDTAETPHDNSTTSSPERDRTDDAKPSLARNSSAPVLVAHASAGLVSQIWFGMQSGRMWPDTSPLAVRCGQVSASSGVLQSVVRHELWHVLCPVVGGGPCFDRLNTCLPADLLRNPWTGQLTPSLVSCRFSSLLWCRLR